MTDQTPNEINEQEQEQEQEPFIPPRYLLILAALGFIVALFVALTQPEFGVIGYGGIAFGLLALVMWVLLSPQEARAVITGRTARFGGTSLLVTIVLLVALVGVYVVVRNEKWSVDLTQSNTFSLSPESRKAIEGLAAEPNTPKVEILAFFGPAQASNRDQDTLLFDDYVKTSKNKISYQFIDPERQPQTAKLYNIASAGNIVVVKLDDKGQPVTKNAQTVTSSDQGQITNAILKVSSSGVFNAYFLNVKDGTAAKMTNLKNILTNRYGWNVNDVSLTELGNTPDSRFNLSDPNVTGQVIVIPGGSAPLADAELKVLEDYINKGGTIVIMAGTNLNADHTSLATAKNLSDYLWQNFGVKFNPDVVIDKTQAFQSALVPVSTNLSASSYITSNGIPAGQGALVFETPNSISIASPAPSDVTVVKLAQSTPSAYAKTDLAAVLNNNIDKANGDAGGPLVLAASAENTKTKARVILLGSTSLGDDNFALFQGVDNLSVTFNSLIWATHFNDYYTQITVQQQRRPQDQPIFASQQQLRNINFITIVLLPFGILLIGVLVWWNNRERSASWANRGKS